MAAYLICVTTDGGLPLFIRKRSEAKVLPYSLVASLNGAKMYGKSRGIDLLSTVTKDARVVWQDFHNSVTLIGIGMSDDQSDLHLKRLIQNVFDTMVLLVGLDDIIEIQSFEGLKHDLQSCYGLVDKLLEGFQPESCLSFGDLCLCADVASIPDQPGLQYHLDHFSEVMESTYGCVMSTKGFMLAATKNWWSLNGRELALLSMLITLESTTMADMPVFLPYKSPNLPFRLVTCQLVPGLLVCLLCGTNPTLPSLEVESAKFWQPLEEILKIVTETVPKNFPHSVMVDQSIIGFLLVNLEKHRCLSSMCPSQSEAREGRTLSVTRKLDILRSFYRSVIGAIFPDVTSDDKSIDICENKFTHAPLETYWCSEFHKCHAVQSGAYQMFVVYNTEIPNHTMRLVTERTLRIFSKEKIFK